MLGIVVIFLNIPSVEAKITSWLVEFISKKTRALLMSTSEILNMFWKYLILLMFFTT